MYPLTTQIKTEFPYFFLGLGALLLLVLLKVTKAIALIGNLIVCLVFYAIASTALKSGGIYSHDLPGLFLVLICSVSLLDIKYTYLYSMFIFAFIGYVYYLGIDPAQLQIYAQQRLQYSPPYYLVLSTLFVLMPVIFLTVLSKLNSELINNLRSTNIKLDEANVKLDTERSNLIMAKSELEKSNLKLERYAHTASHDLQQPIRTIISFTQLLSKKLQRLGLKDDKIDEYLAQVVSGTKRMDAQVQDLLSFSKVSNQEKGHIYDLNEIVDDVLTDLSDMVNNANAKVEVGNLPKVNVIKSNLSQVFQNLISNAIKYRKPTSKVKVKISSYEKNGLWVIAVSDNGKGMPESEIGKIFRLYTQLSKENEGLGIGLATCQQIIESYGGQIWVESELGKGSNFFFTLPKIIDVA